MVASRRPAAATRHFAAGRTVISLKRLFAPGWLHKSQRLHIVAFDVARGPDGAWWVVLGGP